METISEAFSVAVRHYQAGRLPDAEQSCRQILAVEPNHVGAWHLLGSIALQLENYAVAVRCIEFALERNPDYAAGHHNLGIAFWEQQKLDEAVASYRRALKLAPGSAQTHYNLGLVYQHQGKLGEAAACYSRALELNPNIAEALNNLGNTFKDLGKLDEAVNCFLRALELKPDYPEAHCNLGAALQEQGKLDDAGACYRRALERRPDFADAHWCQAALLLLAGDFECGWPELEWRWQRKELPPRGFQQPLWDGRPLTGKTILVHAEQGLGDTIQFVRYVPVVKERGATVILECQQALLPLFAVFPVDQLIGRGTELPTFDIHAPLMSLPRIFSTRLENIPHKIPYLSAAPQLVQRWREELQQLAGFRIGIGWQGSLEYHRDRQRSFKLDHFAAVGRLPGVTLISLQKGAGADQLGLAREFVSVVDLAGKLDEASGPFMDTAAIMKNLDLVITSDSSIAHLAGALGVPVWLALSYIPDWRWLLERSDSPWYPTMRLFRQKSPGDWTGVFEEIGAALREVVSLRA
jgi:tetratricopeptide (TPR) repeat protein